MTGSRPHGALLALALALGLARLPAAQVAVHVGVGARYSGTLVHDSVVAPLDVRPALAPAFAVTVALAPHRGWSGEAMLDVSWSTLRRHDAGGASTSLGGLGAVAFAVGLRRQLAAGVGARATVGGLKYLPADEAGIFRGGASEVYPVLGFGVDYQPPFARGFTLEARADAHRFLTQALRDAGFTEHRLVPRVTLVVRADLTRVL